MPLLPRRDWRLLPLIAVATILLMCAGGETAARLIWPEKKADSCTMPDPVLGHRFKPNCASRTKLAEGPWVDNVYNECGYRGESSCGSRPAGTLRIAVIGSSFAEGYMVPYKQMFATQTAERLGRACGRTVQMENLAVPEFSLMYMYRRMDEVILLRPDVVVFSITPYDLHWDIGTEELASRKLPAVRTPPPMSTHVSLYQRFRESLSNSRLLTVAQHFLYSDEANYLRLYFAGVPAAYFRRPVAPEWQEHYRVADLLIGEMADAYHQAGIPVILMPGVIHNQAALVHAKEIPDTLDPYAFYRQMEDIASRHGMLYIDTLQPFRALGSQDFFYPVDSHPTGKGQAIFADLLARKLVDGSISAFSGCSKKQASVQEGRR
jgi:hypothetical protein